MKPTSIVFLILSVILIAGGAVTCIAAQKMAEADGVQLFFQDIDNDANGIETNEIESASVNKITLKLKDVDVIVKSGAEKSEIKLINFSKNTYEYSVSNKNLTVSDSISIFSLFNITKTGIGFGGLRHYLYYDRYKDRQKSIEIYLGKNEQIKQFDISVKSGSITISGTATQADYKLAAEKGDITIGGVNLVSTITADIGEGNFSLDTPSITGNITVAVEKGNVTAALVNSGYRSYELSADRGVIDYFGETKNGGFKLEPIAVTGMFKADVKNGDITLIKTQQQSNAATQAQG